MPSQLSLPMPVPRGRLELADALLAPTQHVESGEADGVRQRMEERDSAIKIGGDNGRHGSNYNKFY